MIKIRISQSNKLNQAGDFYNNFNWKYKEKI